MKRSVMRILAGKTTRAMSCLLWCLFMAAAKSWAAAPGLEFRAPAAADAAAAAAAMRDLAARLLPIYQEADPDRYLANLSGLQMVAGNAAAADVSRQSLRNRRQRSNVRRPSGEPDLMYDLYAYAMALEAENGVSFAEGFARSFHEVVSRLNDQEAYALIRMLQIPPAAARDALRKALDEQRTNDIIGQSEAIQLIWKYLAFDAYRSFAPLVGALGAEDDHRRYTEDDLLIKTADGGKLSVRLVRPKDAKPLPALLEFTIYDTENYAMECAAHGYVGVVAYTRGKHTDPGIVVPYQRDGADADTVINWVSKQPWSDGRVGMYGNGYSGFTPWAAAKNPPPALRAIAVSAPNAPGIDVPMAGGIFQNSAYRWSAFVTDAQQAEKNNYYDDARWRALDQTWYRSGRRYRDLGRLNGNPNPIFIRWLNHPSYDRYWQRMVPYREEFAGINMPVLTTTGYYAGSEPGALYYFTQHQKFNPRADHTLLIGPYDDSVMQHGPSAMLQSYEVDTAALIDVREVRYQWFDHVLKGAPMPSLLTDRVNYEVMGANEWRHAASIEAMSRGSLKFFLDAGGSGERHRLTQRKSARAAGLRQTVSLTDRSDDAWTPPADFTSRNLATHNAVMFVSEPMAKTAEFSGLFSGKLDFKVNKMDLDLNITLYELLPGGDYIYLFNPTYEFRASYARDRIHRHLLRAGERQELLFKSERMTSRRFEAGSRLVMILGVNKRPDREINYGTANDVSEDGVADGETPIKILWYGDSYIEIPIRR